MKTALIYLYCLVFSTPILAQAYLPMAVEGAHWAMFEIDENGPDHHIFILCGDTTINGSDYKKMYRENLTDQATSPIDFVPPYFSDEIKLIGALRDDTMSKKVYFVAFENFIFAYDTCEVYEDVLLHDFSKSVGDTLGGCLYGYPDYPAIVTAIGSELLWGETRKISDCNCGARLVEGVGTDTGPFYPLPFFIHPAKPQVLMDYFVAPVGECPPQVLTPSKEAAQSLLFHIFPNPVHDQLTVEIPGSLTGHSVLTISDFTGKKIWRKPLTSNGRELIPLGNLPEGFYLLTLETDGRTSARKFVKRF